VLSFSCLKKAIIWRGGNNDDDQRSSLSFVFDRSDEGQKKKHKNNGFVPLSLCLRGTKIRRKWRWWRSMWSLSFSIFHKSD
jgi:hypothetical protein